MVSSFPVSDSRNPGFFGSLMGLVIGLVFVFAGAYVHGQRSAYDDGVSVTGTITGAEEYHKKGKTSYSAIVTFTPQGSTGTVSVVDDMTTGSRPDAGEQIEVSYRPADPEGARIVPGFDWFGLAVLGVGALVALLCAVRVVARIVRFATGLAALRAG
jgi:hypothetical protein